LDFRVEVNYLGTRVHDGNSTLAVLLSTESGASPSGAFKDTGSRMVGSNYIILFGAGVFTGDQLAGSEAALSWYGQVSPSPLGP